MPVSLVAQSARAAMVMMMMFMMAMSRTMMRMSMMIDDGWLRLRGSVQERADAPELHLSSIVPAPPSHTPQSLFPVDSTNPFLRGGGLHMDAQTPSVREGVCARTP